MALAGLMVVGSVDILFYLTETTVISRIPWVTLLHLLIFKLPAVLMIFFPMAVLFSIILVLIRLHKDQELVVLHASGISFLRIIRPILLWSVLVTAVAFVFNDRVVPVANLAYTKVFSSQLQLGQVPQFLTKTLFKVDERFFYIQRSIPEKHRLEKIFIFEPGPEETKITTAAYATWHAFRWELFAGQTYGLGANGELRYSSHFGQASLAIKEGMSDFYSPPKSPKEMNLVELMQLIARYTYAGVDAKPLRVEFWMRFSFPVSCVVFSLLGIGVCHCFIRNRNGWWGIVMAIGFALLSCGFYFFMMAFLRSFALEGRILPSIGLWIPNAFFFLLSLLLIFVRNR